MAIVIKIENPIIDDKGKIKAIIKSGTLNAVGEIQLNFSDLIEFASKSNKNALDFCLIASFVYGIDRFVARHTNSVDGWSREMDVMFPVYNVQLWQQNSRELEEALSFLTGDYWKVSFCLLKMDISDSDLSSEYTEKFDQLNLFSGGLDSLIGAIDFLEGNKKGKLLMVSHYDPQMRGTRKDQEALHDELFARYKNRIVRVPSVEMSLKESNIETEKTFRSRSLLFLGIAVLVSQFQGIPIVVPENGAVSLNYPLSDSRRSACSTRTTHPTFISKIRKLLNNLNIKHSIENPYEFFTKGEMVQSCAAPQFLTSIIGKSNSCGKRGHVANWTDRTASHCGVCMPCVYRRASLQNVLDSTDYGNSINKAYTGRQATILFYLSKQGQDIGACLGFLKRDLTDEQIKNELLINGVNDLDKIDKYVDLVKRTRDELIRWISIEGDKTVKSKAGIL